MSAAPTPQLDLALLDAARAKVPAGIWTALNHRQQLFVAALLADPKQNHAEAARTAGYAPKYAKVRGFQLLKLPLVKAALAVAVAERIERTQVDADFVITQTTEVLKGAKDDREWGAANGSLTLLARHLGMLTDKVKVDFRDVSALSDEELEAEARALGVAK